MQIKLRLATLADADLLLAWRNDSETRQFSHHTHEISRSEHIAWLAKTLANPERKLFIAELAGKPVGTVRADHQSNVWEISWTIAPEARGQGIGKEMVRTLALQIQDPIRAEIKAGNVASIKIAEFAGLHFSHESQGTLHYIRSECKTVAAN